MDDDGVKLVSLTLEMEAAYREMAEEFHTLGQNRFDAGMADFPAYLRRQDEWSRGIGLAEGSVPGEGFWLVDQKGKFLGCSTFRYHLTPALEREGGHIGYIIRPSERRKGYGTKILALTLVKAREKGYARVMVTCDQDNIASAKIIEKNGGRYDGETISERTSKPVSHYWIEL